MIQTMEDRISQRPAYPNPEAPYNTIPRTSRFLRRQMGRFYPKYPGRRGTMRSTKVA